MWRFRIVLTLEKPEKMAYNTERVSSGVAAENGYDLPLHFPFLIPFAFGNKNRV